MKVFVFRCRSRREMQAATRFETGSNLPSSRCSGGWEFAELVDLTEVGSSRLGIDPRQLRRRVQQNGYYVWESGAEARDPLDAGNGPPLPELTAAAEALAPVPQLALDDTVPTVAPVPVVQAPSVTPDWQVATAQPVARQILQPPLEQIAQPVSHQVAQPVSRQVAQPISSQIARPVAHHIAPPPRHQVVWFDIPVRDLERAILFYSAVLGTVLKKEQAGPGMAMAVLPHPDGAIGGCLVQTMDARPADGGPLLYLNTEGRLDEAVAAVPVAGGTVLQPKHSIGPYGYRAIVLDSEGNRIALHST